jgi:diguanylate cyclase (GGDEF)-like protein
MTLYRQLLIFTFLLFLFLFAGTWETNLQNTRAFLEEQLESHAQDTATSLGLSITSYLADNDIATVDTMINVVFDRGYYKTIRLTDLEENVLIERFHDVVISDVPQWFINNVSLQVPEARSLISSGWLKKGYLLIESHPGYAYNALWRSTITMTKVFLVIGVVVLVCGALILRLLLRPLRRVEAQAENLCNKKYTFQQKLPKTRELRQVVVAMNGMTEKVKKMFDEQADIADKLRTNVYVDSLTGLGNRRFLEGQVNAAMERKDRAVCGSFLLIEVQDLHQQNLDKGYEYVDTLLQRVALCIKNATIPDGEAVNARLSGGAFSVFLPDVTETDARRLTKKIAENMNQLSTKEVGMPETIGHIGAVSFDKPTPIGDLLSTADQALRAAQSTGPNSWVFESYAPHPCSKPRGQMQWVKTLDRALGENAFRLYGQPIYHQADRRSVMHLEILSRITINADEEINAGVFIPLAERLGRITDVDKAILEKAIHLGRKEVNADSIAINISATSLRDETFVNWLINSLKTLPSNAPRFIFEFAEFRATQDLDRLLDFSEKVKNVGHSIGLDHFGKSFANFGYLRSLQPHYVKIDRAFTDELTNKNSDSHFFISALASVAHSIDVMVIVEGVEDDRQLLSLGDLNIDGVQGYHLATPALLQ